jgi:hypothetical protein
MKKLLLPVFILFVNLLFSQEMIRITGKIADSATGQPLPFAQISLEHTGTGTSSNEEGVFQLNISQIFADDTLKIYYLGYEPQRIPVKKGIQGEILIFMKPGMLQLKEVEIVGFTPQEVIRMAVARIPRNYGKDSLILTAFIRSQKSVNNKLAEYTEAIIEDLKTGYFLYKPGEFAKKHERSNIPFLLKGRVTSDTNLLNALGDAGRNAGCLSCNFINDLVEFYHKSILDEALFRYYDLKMEEMTGASGGKIYHIWYSQKNDAKEKLWKGELFIEGSSFAVIKIMQKPSMNAYAAYEKTKFNRVFTILGKPGWIQEMPFIQQTIAYSRKDTTWYLSSIRTENWLTFTYPLTGQKVKFNYKNDVVITDVTRDRGKIKNFKGDKITGTSRRWDQIVGPPDNAFWTRFNFLPIEKTLGNAVEKIGK